MQNIVDVDTFTSPVTVLENGDPVDESVTDPTIQALANRTAYLKARLDVITFNTAANAITVTATGTQPAITGNGNATGNGIRGVGGATGTTVQGVGVIAEGGAAGGHGVYAQSFLGGSAVAARSNGTGAAVFADGGNNGPGVTIITDANEYALSVSGKLASPGKSALRLAPQNAQPSGPNQIGDMYMTTAGVLKVCTVAGTPGTWQSVGAQT